MTSIHESGLGAAGRWPITGKAAPPTARGRKTRHVAGARTAGPRPGLPERLGGREWALYLVAAGALLGLLIWVNPEFARHATQLAERALSALAAGGLLFTFIAKRGLKKLRREIESSDPNGAPIDRSRSDGQINRCWQLGLLLVAAWLIAAVSHLASASFLYYHTQQPGEPVTAAGLAATVMTTLELQMLAGEIALLVAIVIGFAIEEALRKDNNAVVRVYLTVLTFVALVISAVSHVPQPLSMYGWLVGWHVGAFAGWLGLAFLLRISRDSDARFLRFTADQFSQLAAVMSSLVLVTGGALGAGWTTKHFSELLNTLPGWALILKVLIGLVLILAIGQAHRRFSLQQLKDAPAKDGTANATWLWRLGLVELIGMGIATSFGVIL